MKTTLCLALALLMTGLVRAETVRVVILDFENETGLASDAQLGGAIDTDALSKKGTHLITQQMLGTAGYTIVDQRDFMEQMGKLRLDDQGKPSPLKPSYLDAARALNADILLRGSMMSFSTGKQKINQGGHKVTMAKVSMSVALQAQDVVDGAVVAMSTGNANQSFRQTESLQTELSEDDVLGLMNKALAQAVPKVTTGINKKMGDLASRPRVTLTVTATENPAMVEIDGVLVGSTPMTGLEVYPGEHLFHISSPGYESITKRIKLTKDAEIKVPMLRTDLSAEEKVEVLKSADLRAYMTDGRPDLVIQTLD